jgi:hypothetical protein
MTKHRREIAESRREHEKYMRKRAKDFTMDLLPPNRAFWRRYHKGHEKLILFPILKYKNLSKGNGESSHDLMPSESMVNKDQVKGGKLQIRSVDLTLKLWFS